MNTVAVEVKHLSKKFQIDKNKDISVLRDISFEANYGIVDYQNLEEKILVLFFSLITYFQLSQFWRM